MSELEIFLSDKEWVNPPFNYTGSKFKLLPQIVPLFDHSKYEFVDLFAGGGAFYTNVVDKFQRIWVNDIIQDLVSIHQLLLTKDFFPKVQALCVGKEDAEGYSLLRDSYNESPTPEKLFALMLCCTNNMLRFNNKFKFNQTFGKRTCNESTLKKVKLFQDHLRPFQDKITYTTLPFWEVPIRPEMMIAADPPYSGTEAGYNAYWNQASEDRLLDYLLEADRKGASFCLSGVMGSHKGNKESRILLELQRMGFTVKNLTGDYRKVARDKEGDQGQEVVILNY